jgi:hypothetical protein
VVNAIFGITVDRLCRVRSETVADQLPFPLDGDGFLDPSVVEAGIADVPELGAFVPTPVAAAKGALVLLGEPGVGKTTEFQRVIGDLKFRAGESSDVKVAEVDAADLSDATTFDELVGRHLQALPARTTELDDSGSGDVSAELDVDGRGVDLVLVIDQLDESPLLRHLAMRLRNALAGRDSSRLCIILGCRTADYPSEVNRGFAIARPRLRSGGSCSSRWLFSSDRDDSRRWGIPPGHHVWVHWSGSIQLMWLAGWLCWG